jgi:hypothetical protein
MRQACVALIVMLGGALAGGCSGDPYASRDLGAAREVVVKSIDNLGGLDAWRKVQSVQAVAIVASYDNTGAATVDRVKLSMDFNSGVIRATGRATQGEWSAKAAVWDGCETQGPAPSAIASNLAPILYRCRGPLNFLHGDKVLSIRRDRVNGVDVDRVGAAGPNGQRAAYYFDAVTGLLRFLSAGDETPGGHGTITSYGKESYVMLPNGLVFPRKFRILQVGQDTLVGEKPVLEVEFSDIKAQ